MTSNHRLFTSGHAIRTFRRAGLLALTFLLVGWATLRAGIPVLVDFENLAAGTAVFNQYDGVTFIGGDGLNFDSSHPITIFKPASGTISPTRALKVAFQRACEFCGTQLMMKFDESQYRVSLSTGLAENYSIGVTYLLQGFSNDPLVDFGSLITQTVAPCLGTSPGVINTPLQITDGAGRHAYPDPVRHRLAGTERTGHDPAQDHGRRRHERLPSGRCQR